MTNWILGIVGGVITTVVISLFSFVAITVNENSLEIAKYQDKFAEMSQINEELLEQVQSYETLTYQNWVAINFLYQHLGITRNHASSSPFRKQSGSRINPSLRNGMAERPGRKPRPIQEVDATGEALGAREWGGPIFGSFTL